MWFFSRYYYYYYACVLLPALLYLTRFGIVESSFFISSPISKYRGPSFRNLHMHELNTIIRKQIYSSLAAIENDQDVTPHLVLSSTTDTTSTATDTNATTITTNNKRLTTLVIIQCVTMIILQNTLAIETSSEDFIMIAAPPKQAERNFSIDPRYLLAGGACAAFSHGIATPLDVIKTKMQANREKFDSGFVNAAMSIVQKGGVGVLLSGLVPTLLGYGVEGAVKFGMYESLKPVFVDLFHGMDDKTIPYLAASVGAGAVASLLLVPMERSRIEVVTAASSSNHRDGGRITDMGEIIRKEGFSSLFYGYNTMLMKQVPYTMTKQVSFDLLATYLFAWAAQPHDNIPTSPLPTEQVKFLCTTTSAFMASILACISSQPGDVLLTKIYKERHSLISSSPCGMLNAMTLVKTVYREEGLGGLFAGLSARLAHVATIVTLQLLVYDYLKQLLGLAATVSDC